MNNEIENNEIPMTNVTIGPEEKAFLENAGKENKPEPKPEPEVAEVVPTVEEVKQEQPAPKPEQPKPEQPKQEMSQEDKEVFDNVKSDRVDPMLEVRHIVGKDMEKTKIKDPNSDGEINFPTGTYKQYQEFYKHLPQSEQDMNQYMKKIGNESSTAVALNAVSESSTVLNGIFADNINNPENDYVNHLEFGGAKLNTRTINISTNQKLTQESAIARIYGLLGVGEVVQVPLWHSGFWVTIKPIKQKDFINLYTELTNSNVELGRLTNTLIYSNYSVVFTRILTEFIISNITEYTIKLTDDASLLDYIKIQDLFPLANGIISAMYPKGLDIVKSCVNTLKFDSKSNEPMCDYSIAAKVDSKKLLWVNRKALDKYMINHMSKRTAGSVSMAEVKEYQSRLKKRSETVITGKSETGVTVKFDISMPLLKDYIEAGERWVNSLIADTEKLYTPQDTDQDKHTRLTDVIASSRLNTYNSYIEKVTFIDSKGTETTFEKPEAIKEVLDTISGDQTLFIDVLTHISKFISNSSIAIIATPNFTCPKCKSSQTDIEANKPFSEFIPLNIIENFFDLGGLRKEGLKRKGLW